MKKLIVTIALLATIFASNKATAAINLQITKGAKSLTTQNEFTRISVDRKGVKVWLHLYFETRCRKIAVTSEGKVYRLTPQSYGMTLPFVEKSDSIAVSLQRKMLRLKGIFDLTKHFIAWRVTRCRFNMDQLLDKRALEVCTTIMRASRRNPWRKYKVEVSGFCKRHWRHFRYTMVRAGRCRPLSLTKQKCTIISFGVNPYRRWCRAPIYTWQRLCRRHFRGHMTNLAWHYRHRQCKPTYRDCQVALRSNYVPKGCRNHKVTVRRCQKLHPGAYHKRNTLFR